MSKWGVRLIGIFFLMAAAYYFQKTYHDYLLLSTDEPITDIWEMDLLIAAVFLYPGIQLLRFRPSGHGCALKVLWMLVLWAGLIIIVAGKMVYDYYTGEIYFGAPTWLNENLRPIATIALPIVVLIFFLISIDFLYREDVELLFKKSVAQQENAPTSDTIPS